MALIDAALGQRAMSVLMTTILMWSAKPDLNAGTGHECLRPSEVSDPGALCLNHAWYNQDRHHCMYPVFPLILGHLDQTGAMRLVPSRLFIQRASLTGMKQSTVASPCPVVSVS